MQKNFYALLLWLLTLSGFAGAQPQAAGLPQPPALPDDDAASSLEFVANRGQWPAAVRYAAAVPGGHLCLEPGGLRYILLQPIEHPHLAPGAASAKAAHPAAATAAVAPPGGAAALKGHQLRVRFAGADTTTALQASRATGETRNYLHGNDPGRWASAVPSYRQVRYAAPWPGVAARFYENGTQHLEYDFEVAAGADAGRVQLRYEGATSLTLSADGQLHVGTTVGALTELAPHAYQLDPASGQRRAVACRYRLRPAPENRVSFELGAYDHARPLVIDPTVVFSTYSGARGSNWGFTATYDAAGNMYSGGIVLDDMNALPSFPTTAGAFQTTFAAIIDIALIKYNTAATGPAARAWATYLGGNRADFPSSLVVNAQGELIVLGSTSSTNYPTTSGAVQRTFGGGTTVDPFGDDGAGVYRVSNGTDLVVTRLSASGGALAASTYLGGSANDGVAAYDPHSATRQLPQNYGDALRGDVLTDAQGNIYVASVTASGNFPLTSGSFGPRYQGGASDAVVCKLAPGLNRLVWSGCLGGSGADAAYSIQLDAGGNAYVAGGTLSPSFPGTTGGLMPRALGSVDGYVARLAADGSTVQRATYLGTSAYDQAFFVQLGSDAGVYVLGQTLGSWPVSAGAYRNPGSRQFIQKLSPDLDKSLISTVIGSGRNTIDISPTAFLVDQCDRVYVCGWGGGVNQNIYRYGGFVNTNGYTDGLPTTANAVRATPDTPGLGSDFYLAQYAPGLTALSYATFYGDATPYSTGDHVDGGTSRFDPRGVVYAAACSCFNSAGFPVPPGAYTYSTLNGSGGFCNNAAFKLNFEPTVATVGQDATVCADAPPVPLSGLPAGGVWSGPGVTGSVAAGFVFTPSAALVGPQKLTYTLSGVILSCFVTGQQTITVAPRQAAALAPLPLDIYCLQGGAAPVLVPLVGTPAGGVFSGPGVTGSTFSPAAAGNGVHTILYTVGAGTPCATSASRQVAVIGPSAGNDFSLCATNGPVQLPTGRPAGGVWSGPGVTGSVAAGFVFTPSPALAGAQTLTYSVAAPSGTCTATARVLVTVVAPPQAVAPPLPAVCANSGPVPLPAGQPAGGTWAGPGVTGSLTAGYVFTPSSALVGTQVLTYTVLANQVCSNVASTAPTSIAVLSAPLVALPADTVLCPGSTRAFRLRATVAGGIWSGPGVAGGNVFTPPTAPGTYLLTYTVNATSPCPVVTTRRVTLLPEPVLAPALVPGVCVPTSVAPLVVHFSQAGAGLPADALLTWSFGDDSTATATGLDVTHTYLKAGTYRPRVTLRFNQGRCDRVVALPPVVVEAMLIPNVFTPNGDGQNERFAPRLGGCPPRLQVFSRWGQQVYENAAYQNTWDGAGVASGIYYYLLTPPDGGATIKGWVEVLR